MIVHLSIILQKNTTELRNQYMKDLGDLLVDQYTLMITRDLNKLPVRWLSDAYCRAKSPKCLFEYM